MDDKSIKETIRNLRISRGYSQRIFAELIGLGREAYIKLEKGETQIISPHLFKIAEVLDVSPEFLILGFSPLDVEGTRTLEDVVTQYQSSAREIEDRHIQEEDKLRNELLVLRETIKTLSSTIKDKQTIIDLLNEKIASSCKTDTD